jgi:hypothetical protein
MKYSIQRCLILILGLTAAAACGTDNSTAPPDHSTPPDNSGGGGSFTMLAVGSQHTCGLTSTGAAYCWGWNSVGQLGVGSATGPELCRDESVATAMPPFACSTVPVAVSGALRFTALAAGGANTCGLTSAGAAYCWGDNFFGQLGIGSRTGPENCRNYNGGDEQCSTRPLAVQGGLSFTALSVLGDHICGLTRSGAVYCWGSNDLGQLGDALAISSDQPARRGGDYSPIPVAVSGGLTFASLASSAGSAGHTCGITISGAGYCWGYNLDGELGTGSATGPELCNPGSPSDLPCSTMPVAVSGNLSLSAIGVGLDHTCALTRGGAAYCWGSSFTGELGAGSNTSTELCPFAHPCRMAPVAVAGGMSFSALAVGAFHACGLTNSGAYCWGANRFGQLGTGSSTGPQLCSGSPCSQAPVGVSGSLSFRTLAPGGNHTCGVTTSGAAYCWGSNMFGQIGDGTTTQRLVPTLVKSP